MKRLLLAISVPFILSACSDTEIVYRDRVQTIYVDNQKCGTLSRYDSVDNIEDFVQCQLEPYLGEERADYYADMIEDVAKGEYTKSSDSSFAEGALVGAAVGAIGASALTSQKVQVQNTKTVIVLPKETNTSKQTVLEKTILPQKTATINNSNKDKQEALKKELQKKAIIRAEEKRKKEEARKLAASAKKKAQKKSK